MAGEWDIVEVADAPKASSGGGDWDVAETYDDVPPSDAGARASWQATPASAMKDGGGDEYERVGGMLSRFIGSVGRGFNTEVANVLGLPGDVTNRVLDLAGLTSYRATGSKELSQILDESAITRTRMAGDNEVGTMIGGMAPYAMGGVAAAIGSGRKALAENTPVLVEEGAGLARRTWDALRGSWREIGIGAAKAPGAFTAAESAATVGSALGETAADKMFPGNDTAGMIGAVAGGGLPGLAAGAVRGLPGVVAKNTESRVAAFFQRAAGDGLDRAKTKLADYADEFDANLTPAAITGNTGLLRIERSLARSKDDLGTKLRDRYDQTDASLQRAIEDTEPGDATRQVVDEFFDGRIDKINQMVDERITQAARNAERATNEIPPALRDNGTVSRLAREELDRAYDDARDAERHFWSQIDKGYQISTDGLKGRVREIRRQFDDAVEDPSNLPSDVLKAVDDLAGTEDLGRLLKLRSRLLDDIRNARSGDTPNRVKVKHLEEMQEAILHDIGATNDGREALLRSGRQTATAPSSIEARNRVWEVDAVRNALTFSRNLNDKFRRGPVGKLLGYETTGAGRTPADLTLDKIMQPGVKGVLQYKAIIDATGGTEQMKSMMESYLRNRYVTAVMEPGTGTFNEAAHRKFLANHGDIIGDFPKMKADIEDVGARQAMLSAAQASGKRTKALIERSRAQLWLNNDDVQTALAQVLNTPTSVERGGRMRPQKNQGAAAAALMRSADKDATGAATSGVRREFVQVMLRNWRTSTTNPVTETGTLSPAAMRKWLTKNQPAVGAILAPDQEQRLRRIVTELEKSQRVNKVTMGGGSDTFENTSMAANILARVVGGHVGAAIGSGTNSLQTASIGARLTQRFVQSLDADKAAALIEQAILDPKVMQDMLSRNVTGVREREMITRLRANLIAAGAQDVEDPEE